MEPEKCHKEMNAFIKGFKARQTESVSVKAQERTCILVTDHHMT